MIAEDGSYIDIDSEVLKKYMVYAQGVEPDSESRIEYEKNSKGNDYDNLVEHQSHDQIDLYVKVIE